MKHDEITALERANEDMVKKCDWCNVWKPLKDVPAKNFFNTTICYNCYYNFQKMTSDEANCQSLLDYMMRRMRLIVKVKNDPDLSVLSLSVRCNLPEKIDYEAYKEDGKD